MNTERDNFYDWAKDKPDTTNFANLNRSPYGRKPVGSGGLPWGRLGLFVMVAMAVVAAIKYFVQ